jgi:hypothetical protein
MSQNGRREFLTSATAVAAALAACTAPARRAQAQPPACVTMYDEAGLVSRVAPFVHIPDFRNELITFTVPRASSTAVASPTMAYLNRGAGSALVDSTLAALTSRGVTSVTVTKSTYVPLGTYDLISSGTTPGPGKRWPVVLTLAQERAGSFIPDWSQILLFVIPDPKGPGGHDITTSEAHAAMCVHPFGM